MYRIKYDITTIVVFLIAVVSVIIMLYAISLVRGSEEWFFYSGCLSAVFADRVARIVFVIGVVMLVFDIILMIIASLSRRAIRRLDFISGGFIGIVIPIMISARIARTLIPEESQNSRARQILAMADDDMVNVDVDLELYFDPLDRRPQRSWNVTFGSESGEEEPFTVNFLRNRASYRLITDRALKAANGYLRPAFGIILTKNYKEE